ncbi:MAG: TonB-dependent siderophore receptor [Leptolyngbyaceae cyanobacterium]
MAQARFNDPVQIINSPVDIAQWIAQVETSQVEIIGVRLAETEVGLRVVLEITAGELTVPTTAVSGNAVTAEIPHAGLTLPDGDEFLQFEPIAGIALVQVSELPDDRVQVTITGNEAAPAVEIVAGASGLTLNVTPGVAQAGQANDRLRIVVTGEGDEGYNPSSATVGTRTDTPLRDIPQTIQVIPQAVIEDQQATQLSDVLQNATGVAQGQTSPRTFSNNFLIRGLDSSDSVLINGLPDPTGRDVSFGANIEQVEVLRGPASVLFGQGQLGGAVNLVTKQPLSEPFYSLDLAGGTEYFYRGAIDLSGPINDSGSVLYRLYESAQTTESFVDFYDQQRYLVAPVLSWQISDRTQLTLEADYSAIEAPFDFGIPAEGSVLSNPNGEISRDLFVGEPDIDNSQNRVFRIGYDLDHRFSNNWQFRSVFRTSLTNLDREIVFSTGLEDDLRTLNRAYDRQDYDDTVYNMDNYVTGEFSTGSLEHQLVAGINLFRRDTDAIAYQALVEPLDIFEPEYGGSLISEEVLVYDRTSMTEQAGLYVQDLISLTDDLKVLLSGRFDIANQDFQDTVSGVDEFSQAEEFSPRVGIVYQPIQPVSLYASYGQSFNLATSTLSAAPPEPEEGEQYEIGVKVDISDQLSATLALYDLTRSNVPTSDPNDPTQTIQVGEQRSRGVEVDIGGEILPGWNVITGYAYTDTEVTEDNTFDEGNRLNNVPEHAFNLWTTYEIQSGNLQGLGFGLGIIYAGERPGDLDNSFELPSYTRTDAAVFYRRDNYRISLNIENLFDIDYFVAAQNRNRVFPGEPLTLVGSFSWEF